MNLPPALVVLPGPKAALAGEGPVRLLRPPEARDLVGHDGALRTSPDVDGLDGFFAVRLRRDDGPGR